MRISLRWLQDFVEVQDFMAKPEVLGDLLTKAGLEVEETVNRAKDFNNVVTGLIVTKDKHPGADKLSLCQVMTSEGVVHQIVCGAQNHAANDKVVVALPGAVLPGNFAIKKAVVRGVESGGMLCSSKELGLAKESEGIMILPKDTPIGVPFAKYAGLDDITFELKVTPNRADCLSHFGLAREVACLTDRPLKKHAPVFPIADRSTKQQIALDVQDSEACPRYCGRFVSGVKVGPSPDWLVKRLESVGLNPINNVVDVTNYVMMEMGQPLHAFDAREIRGNKIVVAKARAGETFTTLDGTEKKLTGEELMINDGERAVAMAGVVGGKNSGVSETTTDLFLEAAYFEPSAVRRAARLHGIQTDSAYRFTRGVDPDGTLRAMDRACELILQVAGGTAFSDPHDFYPRPVKKTPIRARLNLLSQRLGYAADAKTFETFMTRLGCGLEKGADGEYQVLPPTFRFDLDMEMDLVEEYARLHGYDQIPESLPLSSERPASHDLNYRLRQKLSRVLRGAGLSEAQNYAFTSEKGEREFLKNYGALSNSGLKVSEQPIRLVNPLSEEWSVMRASLSYSLWKNVLHNFHQGNDSGRLFEIGKTFEKGADGSAQEHWRVAGVAWGEIKDLWNPNPREPLVLQMREVVNDIFAAFGITNFKYSQVSDKGKAPGFLHSGQFAIVEKEGARLGILGTVHPVLLNSEKVRVPVAMFELELEPLFRGQPRALRTETFSRFPKIERDLALLMPKHLAVADVMGEIKKTAGALLTNVRVFDQYEGEKLPAGQRSVAFRLSFQEPNGTLQDEVVQGLTQKVLDTLQQKWGLTTR